MQLALFVRTRGSLATHSILLLALVAAPLSLRADTEEAVSLGVGAAVLATITCTTLVRAATDEPQPDDYARRGFGVSIAGFYAFQNFEDDLKTDVRNRTNPPVTSLSLDDSWGGSLRGSYRCHEYFSTEVAVDMLDSFDGDGSAGGQKVLKTQSQPLVTTVSGKGHLLTGRIQPFVLAGVGGVMVKQRLKYTTDGIPSRTDRRSDFAFRVGGGVDYYATKQVVVSAEIDYVGTPFGDVDIDYLSIGLGAQYRF